jgi:hypothetical protein
MGGERLKVVVGLERPEEVDEEIRSLSTAAWDQA